ncbi:uncharacterized protein [Miscanthus floridulus]|uniref:uncharacterized protein n=1 Tax=Miscanthus floridulus TaxID=154761 RepID=UPI003458FA0E
MGLFASAAKRCSNGKKLLRSADACCCSPSASAPGGVRGKEEASTSAPASTPDSKKKRWRNRTFWRKKRKANKESGDGSSELADLVNNISAKSDVCKNVNAAEEILRGSNQNMLDRNFNVVMFFNIRVIQLLFIEDYVLWVSMNTILIHGLHHAYKRMKCSEGSKFISNSCGPPKMRHASCGCSSCTPTTAMRFLIEIRFFIEIR